LSGEQQALDRLNVPTMIKEALKEFLAKVKKVLGDPEVYLFGSYARGDWLYESDLDLIVVSRRFKGLDLGKRYTLVRKLISSKVSVELLLYTPEEFERVKKKSIVIQDAMEYWIKLL